MSKILVFTEFQNNKIKRSSQELLQYAASTGKSVVAAVLGSASALAEQVGGCGATEAHIIKDPSFDSYNPEMFTSAVCDIIKVVQPTIILASASSTAKDLFPRIAAKLNAGVVSDGVELKLDGENITVKKPLFAGKCFADAQFQNSEIKIVLMRANQLPVTAPTDAKAKVVEHSFAKADLKTLIKNIVKGTSEKLDLTEANIIVSGGRGLKEASGFKMLHDLADTLGATVGASRAVVDAGWVSHSMQVGQTGKTVAPSLYIAVGISGAIQHIAGMNGSKVIVAINNDPNAPIFQKSNYGIVGDAFEIIPLLNEEFKKALNA